VFANGKNYRMQQGCSVSMCTSILLKDKVCDGVVPSSVCNFFGGVEEASLEENEQGSHVESWTP